MTREEMAEWVGYYFGLQRAMNIRILGTSAQDALLINTMRECLQLEMEMTKDKLPPGTIDSWPKTNTAAGA